MDGPVGVLHPGAMGAAVAGLVAGAGRPVHWLPAGRSGASARRAAAAGLRPLPDLAALARTCEVILSVCPPAAALDVARAVADAGFGGLYVEANAISPGWASRIDDLLGAGGARVVDGGIVGPPPASGASARLYLSGPPDAVRAVADLFAGTALTAVPLDGGVGRASALKLAFASYNKISYVLAAQAAALAAAHDVLPALLDLAADKLPGTPLARPDELGEVAARAWRWGPELRQLGEACAAAGLVPGVAEAAAQVLDRWRARKDTPDGALPDLLADLTDAPDGARPSVGRAVAAADDPDVA